MRNKTIRHLSLVLALMLFAGVLAACNNGSGGSTQGSGQGGTSGNKGEKVTLQFYMLGDAPKICLLLNPRSISWLRLI